MTSACHDPARLYGRDRVPPNRQPVGDPVVAVKGTSRPRRCSMKSDAFDQAKTPGLLRCWGQILGTGRGTIERWAYAEFVAACRLEEDAGRMRAT